MLLGKGLTKLPDIMERIFPTEPISYVQAEFRARKKRNGSYSVRAFARDLGLSPSHLSEFLSGKSNLSHEKADLLADKLKLQGEHRSHWSDLLTVHSKYKKDRDAATFRICQRMETIQGAISEKVFRTISDWYFFALICFFGGNPQWTTEELCSRTGLSEDQIEEAIDTLVELQLLRPIDNGYEPTDDYSFVGNNLPSEAIKKSHGQILDKAKQALESFDMTERESQSCFVSIPQNQLATFYSELRKRVLETAAEFSTANVDKDQVSVQAITLQIFPIKNPGK